MSLQLGVIADDLTGATDVGAALREEGLRTVLVLGVPEPDELADLAAGGADAVVVALKTRTAPVVEAVEASRRAARVILDAGAPRLYQKYCSTFDSTDEGNIGPVAEALLDELAGAGAAGTARSLGTPATPRVGRTQYQGHLFVGDRLLSESPLRDHPLTPMRDADLVRVLGRQTSCAVALVPHAAVRGGVDAVVAALESGSAPHVLADALGDADLDVLAEAVERMPNSSQVPDSPRWLTGGGAGLARALARRIAAAHVASAEDRATTDAPPDPDPVPDGGRLVLSGSASAQTRVQVAAATGPRVRVDPLARARVDGEAARLRAELDAALQAASPSGAAVLVTATDDPAAVRRVQAELGADAAAELVERTLGDLARHAVTHGGVTRVLVAGGETSGAVAAALGVRVLELGRTVAPGVPWTRTVLPDGTAIALLLKSGNFGDDDLFDTAWGWAP